MFCLYYGETDYLSEGQITHMRTDFTTQTISKIFKIQYGIRFNSVLRRRLTKPSVSTKRLQQFSDWHWHPRVTSQWYSDAYTGKDAIYQYFVNYRSGDTELCTAQVDSLLHISNEITSENPRIAHIRKKCTQCPANRLVNGL